MHVAFARYNSFGASGQSRPRRENRHHLAELLRRLFGHLHLFAGLVSQLFCKTGAISDPGLANFELFEIATAILRAFYHGHHGDNATLPAFC